MDEAERLYNKVKELTKSMSMNRALQKTGKSLVTFRRISPIFDLKNSSPHVYKEVSKRN
jgi:hypothetical protein